MIDASAHATAARPATSSIVRRERERDIDLAPTGIPAPRVGFCNGHLLFITERVDDLPAVLSTHVTQIRLTAPVWGRSVHGTYRKEGVGMSVTDNFAKLKEQVEKADRTVKAAAEQNQAEIKAKLDGARRDADERAAELRAKTDEAAREGESNWREMQADLKRHIERVRERMDAKKAAVDANVADRDADWAEADAEDAIAFALSAIVEAEYATLDAMLAREDAAKLAASSS